MCKATTIRQWTAHKCSQTHCICLIWMLEAVWGGCQPQLWCNDIILTPHKWPRTPKSELIWVVNCVRLLPYAYGQHINVLKHFVYVLYECRKRFEVAVSLNHDVMTSFWTHMSDPEPQNLSLVLWVKLCKAATKDVNSPWKMDMPIKFEDVKMNNSQS